MDKDKEALWNKIDSRPVPGWFDEAKLGIFIHWGIYSVPAYAPRREEIEGSGMTYSEWYEWQVEEEKLKPFCDFHRRCYPGKSYRDLVNDFKAELFDPDEWADMIKGSGARYIVLVAKHHDGFCLWDSTFTPGWNSVAAGPKRDIADEVLSACEKRGVRRGLYYSLTEWFHPLLYKTPYYDAYATGKMIPELKELVEKYRPEYLFTDGEWATDSEHWHSAEFLDWLISSSPVRESVVYNDRWGNDTRNVRGGVFTSEYSEVNSKAVDEKTARERLCNRKWEECRSLSHSFAYNRHERLSHYLGEKELIAMFAETVSKGGNFLLDVGPRADGTIPPIAEERLAQLGEWLAVNGEAVYGSRPSSLRAENAGFAGSAKNGDARYLFLTEYPFRPIRILSDEGLARAELLGSHGEVGLEAVGDGVYELKLPVLPVGELPCRCVYTVKFTKK